MSSKDFKTCDMLYSMQKQLFADVLQERYS